VGVKMKKINAIGIFVLLIGTNTITSALNIDRTIDDKPIEMIKQSYKPMVNSGNILYVGGSGLNNYSKIQDAIDNASDGDIVFVYNENSPYYENIVIINKSISLIGEDRNTTVIDGFNNGNVVKIYHCSNVNIHGFTVNDAGYKFLEDILIFIDSCDNCVVSNNFLNNSDPSYPTEGVYLSESNNIQITNNVIYDGISVSLKYSNNNTITHNKFLKGYVGFGSSSFNNISYNVLSNGWGFEIFDSQYNNFHFNNIINIKAIGFYIERSSNCDFYMNNIENCKGVAIHFDRCSKNIYRFNSIKRNTFGIWIEGYGGSFYSNNFIKNLIPVLTRDVGFYFFDGNYWNRPMNHPKMIVGLKEIILRLPDTYGPHDPGWFITIPELLFDRNPAEKPYDIPGNEDIIKDCGMV
jgi:parallel beta-helix repeat protein